jgi:hypothetical protein
MVVDDNDQLYCGITPYFEASPKEREQAWQRLRELQQKVQRSFDQQGITEDDLMRELLKDD